MEVNFQSIFHNHQVINLLQSQSSAEGRKFQIVSGDKECVYSNKLWMFSSFIRSIVESLVIAEDITIILPDYSAVDVTNATNILLNNKNDELVFSRKVKEILEALGIDITNTKIVNEDFDSKETIRRDLINEFLKKEDASNISCNFCPKTFHGSKQTDKYKIHLGIIHFTAEMKIEVDKYFPANNKCSGCGKIYESSCLKRRHLIYNHSHLVKSIISLIKDQIKRDEPTEDEDSDFLNQLLKSNQDLSDSDSDEENDESDFIDKLQNSNQNLSDIDSDEEHDESDLIDELQNSNQDLSDSDSDEEEDESNFIDELQNCNQDLSDSENDSDEEEERNNMSNNGEYANDKEVEEKQKELMITNQNLSDSNTDDEDEEANVSQTANDQDVEEDQFQDINNILLQVQDLEDTDSEDEEENHGENEE